MAKRTSALTVVFCLAVIALAQAQNVKIGFINSMTGSEAPVGENLTNGVTLALEDLAKKGIKVEVIKEDDTGKPQVSMSAMEKLATRDKVAGVVGPYTAQCGYAIARVAEKYKIPLMVPVAAKDEITQQGLKWVFRPGATSYDYAEIVIEMASELGKPKTMAIINENTDFGISVARGAKKVARDKGIDVVFEESYFKGSPDYRATLAKIKAKNPDLVFMVSYVADAILLMRQSREVGLQPKAFLGAGAGFSVAQFAKEKDISNYVFSSTQWTPDAKWPGAGEFGKRYEARFGKQPTYHAAAAYTAMMIMAETAVKAGGNRDKIIEALRAGKWNGIWGDIKFADYENYTNQNKHQMLVEQVQNGRHETVYPPQQAAKKPVFPFPGWK
jgi:branched-chain amino acid transport system substrate-binding protein